MKVFELPAPTDHGWTLSENHLQPVWSGGPVMPSTLVDILDVSTPTEDLDSDDEADLEIPDFDDSFSSEDESDNT